MRNALSIIDQDYLRCTEALTPFPRCVLHHNAEGNAVVDAAINALVDQTRSIERAVTALNLNAITIEGSDSLDNPSAVFQ